MVKKKWPLVGVWLCVTLNKALSQSLVPHQNKNSRELFWGLIVLLSPHTCENLRILNCHFEVGPQQGTQDTLSGSVEEVVGV